MRFTVIRKDSGEPPACELCSNSNRTTGSQYPAHHYWKLTRVAMQSHLQRFQKFAKQYVMYNRESNVCRPWGIIGLFLCILSHWRDFYLLSVSSHPPIFYLAFFQHPFVFISFLSSPTSFSSHLFPRRLFILYIEVYFPSFLCQNVRNVVNTWNVKLQRGLLRLTVEFDPDFIRRSCVRISTVIINILSHFVIYFDQAPTASN